MLLTFLCIVLLTTALDATNPPKNRTTQSSSPQRKVSNNLYVPKENQLLRSQFAPKTMKSEVTKANDVIIHQEHNLLGILMSIVTRLMEIKSLTLSDLSWEILSRLFAAAMSVIFGPNTNVLWPEFAHIAVPFLKLLTT